MGDHSIARVGLGGPATPKIPPSADKLPHGLIEKDGKVVITWAGGIVIAADSVLEIEMNG